jgi:protein-S-isoprenylcysteine O-methyltransferase Ste14
MLPSSASIATRSLPLPDYAVFITRFIFFAAAHSLFATRWAHNIFSRTHGRTPKFYRLIYNLASLVLFIWVMAAYRTSPVIYFAPGVWSLVMYGAQAILLGILAVCMRQTGFAEFAGLSQIRQKEQPDSRLATTGWYGIVRHPLYLFSTLFMILNPVMTGQWLLLTILSLIYFVIGGIVEERRLIQEFGEEYQRYRQQVPFMLPSLRRRRTADQA